MKHISNVTKAAPSEALFASRLFPFNEKAALAWATLMADGKTRGRPLSAFDTIIASIAEANECADQVIVAHCGPHRPGRLPEITYQSGGLENPEIRRLVCEILEGGETAFRERARRLRVQM